MIPNYYVGDSLVNNIYSKEIRIRALLLRHKYFLTLSRNLMNVAIELASIEKQLIKEGIKF